MGCDIHSLAQVKKNGVWQTVKAHVAGDIRSYHTFAVLANVRNGVGFAGIKTGETWEPIADPRGLPEDLNLEFNDEETVKFNHLAYDGSPESDFWLGDHSHSHIGLDELKDYLENQMSNDYEVVGYVARDHFIECKENGKNPSSWFGSVNGFKRVNENNFDINDKSIDYIYMSWKVPRAETTNIPSIIKELEDISEENKVSDYEVRIVFGFDS
jgi:hypothetical protein